MGKPERTVGDVPRILLRKAEAAEALGMSVDHLETHVLPFVRCVRSGRLTLIPVAEVERWARSNLHVVRPPTPRPTSAPAPSPPSPPVAQPYPGIFFIEGKSLGHSPTPPRQPTPS